METDTDARNDEQDTEIYQIERLSDMEQGEEPACADCGAYRDLIGPFSFDGNVMDGGDMVCSECAESRGANLTYCTCGTASPSNIRCPGCHDYLGGASSL